MTYENLDFANRTIMTIRGKTRNARRTLSMRREVFDLLKKRREKNLNQYWVFPSSRKPGHHLGSVRKAHDRISEDMGIRGVMDLYNLRRTFATDRFCPGLMSRFCRKFSGTRKSR